MKHRIFISAVLVFSLLISTTSSTAHALDPDVNIGFEEIISGLSSPLGIAHAGDNSGRLFIVLAGGQIVIFDGAQVLSTPFLDISDMVSSGGERGLLGLAFHPNYESNGFFYVNYTRIVSNQLQTVIARYQVSGNSNVANEASASIIMIINQDNTNHNGGQIQFGPDGYLYIGMGDGGGGGDPLNRAQNPTSLLGKMLRIDVNSGSPYSIPATNPFVSDPNVSDEIWAFGLRNPWRFSFDKSSGDLYIADVGQGAWEEVNFQASTSTGGENYGWSCYEGTHDYNTGRDCDDYGVLTDPVVEYAHGVNGSNGCSITGGYVYRGTQYPQINGLYFYGDFCSGKVWAASENASVWTSELVIDTPYLITTFGEDEDGELYVASYGEGKIYKLYVSNFADVPPFHWASSHILSIYDAGITSGCSSSPLNYCPNNPVTRAQMAVFLLRAINGSTYTPPPATGTVFNDVPIGSFAAAWVETFATAGITSGCGSGNYCSSGLVTRAQMAVFLLKAKHGPSYVPPPATGTMFNDVPSNAFAAAWIEQLATEGITGGCGSGNYCPNVSVTRAQMAVFLQKTFSLPLP